MLQQMVDFAGPQQCLGRNAAPVQADAAKVLALHYRGFHPKLSGPDGGDVAAGTAAENNQVECLLSHVIFLAPGQSARRPPVVAAASSAPAWRRSARRM